MKLLGGATANRREFADAYLKAGEGSDSGAHAHTEGTWASVPPKGVTGKSRARGAPKPAHAPWSRSAHERARARHRRGVFFFSPAPHFYISELGTRNESREVWGEVGGASLQSAASKKGEGREILDNVTPSTPNPEPA